MKSETALREACKVLSNLCEAAQLGHAKFPAGALAAVEGFVLLHSHKGAALLGFESGHGAAFRVLRRGGGGGAEEGGPEAGGFALSAPVFVKLSKWAVGIQLGYSSVFTLMAFFHGPQLEKLLAGGKQRIVGETSMHSVEGGTGSHASASAASAGGSGGGADVKVISVADSLMVIDLSMYGGSLAVDTDMMDGAYGTGHVVQDVLNGNVEVPEYLKQLTTRVAEGMAKLTAM
ncbi:hypothetical protein GPECTOR_7g1294 [Gonium pectorale]|uniref:Ysc84 actin-binding domain-containing protein n=1 Tax=Gonium pectorale TaxID=33097 RepID=A0A150GUM9_GONPE|nr:hypothetical protein GPECTOR_7g1294 [Gonium pectorale]|eukprot:KXZ53398.1 hypothetical protein GPECTOR_7g1294 [Gonium pectorale]